MPNVATIAINNNDTADNHEPGRRRTLLCAATLSRFPGPRARSGRLGLLDRKRYSVRNGRPCIRAKRIDVSNAFFYEQEYQQTASYVLRLYREAYGNDQPSANPDNSDPTEAKKVPSYAAFAPDRAQVVGGSGLAQSQLAMATNFAFRPAFVAKYAVTLTGPGVCRCSACHDQE